MRTKLYFNENDKQNLSNLYNVSHENAVSSELQVFEDAIVIPPLPSDLNHNILDFGVIDNELNYILGSGKYKEKFKKYELPDHIEYDEREVYYCGNLSTHYGHFLVESTIRLAYYLKNNLNCYLCYSGQRDELPNFILDFFNLINIPRQKIIIVKSFRKFKSVIVPPKSYVSLDSYSKDFVYPFLQASKNIKPAKYEKIFFSRKDWTGTAKCLGEEDIEKLFNKNGFKSIAMEKLSLKEQIAVIKGAKEIAGINGTAFHNILFSEEPKTLIMLNRNEETDCQYIINEATGAKCNLIQVYQNPFKVNHAHGPFIVGVTKYLKDFLKDYGLKDFSIQFQPNKYLKEFIKLYIQNYSNENMYNELCLNNKQNIDSRDMISILNCLRYSKFKYYLFKILSKTTFGKSRKKFKKKYKELKNIKNASYEFKY